MAGRGRVYLIIYYIGRGGPTPALPGREGEGETENGKLTYPLRRFAPRPPNLEGQRKRGAGGSFYERKKAGWEKRDATKRKDKDTEDNILPSRAHKHVIREYKDESPGRTRASHPGGQGRVTQEDKGESPGRTRASHPGGQGRVTQEDKGESPGRTRASHPGGQGRVVREDGKQCKDRWDKACGCFLIIGFRETGGQTCLLY